MASPFSSINWQAVAIAIGASVFSHSISFRVGSKTVSIVQTAGVPPVHFTFSQALQATEAVLAGASGTITIGDIQVSIS